MPSIRNLILLLAVCAQVIASENNDGFVQSSDFDAALDGNSGLVSFTSKSIADALVNVDKRQYPQFIDTVVSSSIDSIHRRVAPRESVFSPQRFGFNPIASKGFAPLARSAKLLEKPHRPVKSHQVENPLVYDIETIHDPVYKVYKSDENNQGEEVLSALKENPSVAKYFKPPAVTNVEVSHPIEYRKEELNGNLEVESNYKPNPYIPGSSRIRRYTGGRKRKNVKEESEEDDEESDNPYDYESVYSSRPKAFDSDAYSAYKEEKDPKKDVDYPYGYDSGYDHKEYERIKELSEKQAAEIKQNPGNCKEVLKDGMTCMTCKDPKTGGNYESCSYVQEPKNNKYAYSKERKFDSNDEPDVPENEEKSAPPKKSAKYIDIKDDTKSAELIESKDKQYNNYKKEESDESPDDKYKAYYVHSSGPKSGKDVKSSNSKEESEEESISKPYNYKEAIPGFYSDNAPKKDVEHVLAEFKKKDRSACNKVNKNGMTCFQCVDKNGLKHEECMFVSESAPKQSHLAYQELKEFTSNPTTLNSANNEGSESQTVKTTSPVKKTAAYVVDNKGYGKKIKRKKTALSAATAATNTVMSSVPAPTAPLQPRVKRSEESEAAKNAEIIDETNVAPPEEFAGASSHGAFWAETMPRYSASLGVTLPEYMLSRSEHEASFDELVAGA